MARKFETPIDLRGLELLNAKAHNLSADPTGLGAGDKGLIWFNTVSNRWKVWDGTAAGMKATDSDLLQGNNSAYHLARGNHTGSQTASTISDLASTVKAYLLSDFGAPGVDVSWNSKKITNLADGIGNQDAATVAQLNAAVAALVSGQTPKGVVRTAALVNINIASAPSAIDGITLTAGDVVLLTAQTTGTQNGPYTFTSAGAALTRALNWDTNAEAVLGSYWVVEQGTNADTFALLTNDTAITLGTSTPAFIFRGNGVIYTAGNGIDITSGVISAKVVSGGNLTNGGSGLDVDTSKIMRVIKGVIPATTSGIFSVSGSVVTVNHAFSNWSTHCEVRAYTTPYTGYSAGELAQVNDVASDANNIVLTLPAAPAANNWYVSLAG